MHTLRMIAAAAVLCLTCCNPNSKPNTDLSTALTVAEAAYSAYAASPGADASAVAEMARLLTIAQAAVLTWQNSSAPADQAAAAAAIAALVAYEATAQPAHA